MLQPNTQWGPTACDALIQDLMVNLELYTKRLCTCGMFFLSLHFEWRQSGEIYLYRSDSSETDGYNSCDFL